MNLDYLKNPKLNLKIISGLGCKTKRDKFTKERTRKNNDYYHPER